MPNNSKEASPIELVQLGQGGVTGANRSIPSFQSCVDEISSRYAKIQPTGRAPGHNPAYGSVGNDGRWPGNRR